MQTNNLFQADIDVSRNNRLEDIDLDEDLGKEFEYDRNLPVADNFDNFVSMHNDEMAQLRKAYGGYADKDYKNKEKFEEMKPIVWRILQTTQKYRKQ